MSESTASLPPIHLALFLHTLAGGGAERNLVRLANSLSRRGHRVEFVLGEERGPLLSSLDPAIDVRVLGRPGWVRSMLDLVKLPSQVRHQLGSDLWKPKPNVLRFVGPLTGYLRENKPDVLLTSVTKNALVALYAREQAAVATRVVVREANSLGHETSRLGEVRRTRMLGLVREAYPKADGIVCVSEGVAQELMSLTGGVLDDVRAIYNPIDAAAVAKQAGKVLNDDWFAEGRPPVVLAAGRLNAQKRFGDLLNAVAIVRKQMPCRLLILGEGPAREELAIRASELGFGEDFRLEGFVENPYAFMSRASVFVLSSEWEGFPNVLLEALASGCPIVSTDCEFGPSELLDGGRYGSLVDVGDIETMAARVVEALSSQHDPERLRERARFFDPDRCDDAYLEALVGIPATGRPSEATTGTLSSP